ncbi:hypothetical protein MBLNU230_g2738t1 [Neophaeotheca triangularis]
MEAQTSGIDRYTRQVLAKFEDIRDLRADNYTDRQKILDQEARFNLWAGNIGAYHAASDPKSADFRVRRVPEVGQRFVQLLQELLETLEDIGGILSGEREGLMQDEDEGRDDLMAKYMGDDAGPEPESELSELWLLADDNITSLMKISVIVRQSSAGHDRFELAKRAAARHSPLLSFYDIEHVRMKFPKLEGSPKLLRKLGEAITQRRQYLAYARDHGARLAYNKPAMGDEPVPIQEGASTVMYRPTLASTKATTLLPQDIEVSRLQQLDHFDDGVSSVSSIETGPGAEDRSREIQVVPLESLSPEGEPFACPYCSGMVMFKKQKTWRYVLNIHNEYGALQALMHECALPYQVRLVRPRKGIASTDLEVLDPSTGDMRDQNASQAISHVLPSACPFCEGPSLSKRSKGVLVERPGQSAGPYISVSVLERHLAKHLEQLALFAIPPVADCSDEKAGSVSLQHDGSSRSVMDEFGDNASIASGGTSRRDNEEDEGFSVEQDKTVSDKFSPLDANVHSNTLANNDPLQETPAGARPEIQPCCAFCGAPAYPECPHEGRSLESDWDQATIRFKDRVGLRGSTLPPTEIDHAKAWVLNQAKNHVLNSFNSLRDTRLAQWQTHLQSLPYYFLYIQHDGEPPLPPHEIQLLKQQLTQADLTLQEAIDDDWHRSFLKYPEFLDYIFGLLKVENYAEGTRLIIPEKDAPEVKWPISELAPWSSARSPSASLQRSQAGRSGSASSQFRDSILEQPRDVYDNSASPPSAEIEEDASLRPTVETGLDDEGLSGETGVSQGPHEPGSDQSLEVQGDDAQDGDGRFVMDAVLPSQDPPIRRDFYSFVSNVQ